MFYFLTIQNNTTPAVYSFNTFEEALAYYHTELAYRAEGRTSTKCAIFDSDLRMLRQENYEAPVQTPEPTEGEQ